MRPRYLSEIVKNMAFSSQKMAFVSGPRQTGKTTFSKMLLKERGAGGYFNWDEASSPDSLFDALRTRALSPKKEWLEAFANLMKFGGFPEPLFAQDEKKARLWRRGRVEKVIREHLDVNHETVKRCVPLP